MRAASRRRARSRRARGSAPGSRASARGTGGSQEQVLRGEDPDDRAREEEQEAEVRARALAADPPRVQTCRRTADDRQADEPEGVAELADVVADAEVAEPRPLLRELELAAA